MLTWLGVLLSLVGVEILTLIFDNWHVDQYQVESAYEAAALNGYKEVQDLLMALRPDAILMTSISTENIDLLSQALALHPTVVNKEDEFGMTPLHVAVEAGQTDMVRRVT